MSKKGLMEEKVTNAMIKIQKEQTGRGATSGKSYIIQDMIAVRLRGVLTPAESKLTHDSEGCRLIKDLRFHLEHMTRPQMEKIIYDITGVKVISVHGDISTKTGERLEVFMLGENLEEKLN
ncbi:DUF2294 domain-containing protein [Metallumcola ferriviriculae]|uniref:DUF2294 domain-containing protein n=1 Tax=Metallumcola ferriviriculae TaxID=3039180 RepID=A0AAU0UPE6_9FIRM|nr:DUF2294 domain-containing protein [Desulfitibacteraceae bacterium MK1]